MTHTWEDLVPWHYECGITLRALCPVHDPESTTKDDPDCVTACDSCAGRGTVANTSGGPTDCEACGGSGVIRHG